MPRPSVVPVIPAHDRKARKPRRWKPGTVVLRDIRRLQKTTKPLIPHTVINNILRDQLKGEYRASANVVNVLREAAEAELVKFREYCAAQEREIEALQLLLTQNNIQFIKMAKPSLPVRTIDVVAEVNQYIEASRLAGGGGGDSPT